MKMTWEEVREDLLGKNVCCCDDCIGYTQANCFDDEVLVSLGSMQRLAGTLKWFSWTDLVQSRCERQSWDSLLAHIQYLERKGWIIRQPRTIYGKETTGWTFPLIRKEVIDTTFTADDEAFLLAIGSSAVDDPRELLAEL